MGINMAKIENNRKYSSCLIIKEDKFLLFSYDFYGLYRVWVLKRRKLKNSLRFFFYSS